MIGRISRFMTRFVSRWLPDPLIFAMLLTLLTFVIALWLWGQYLPRKKRYNWRGCNWRILISLRLMKHLLHSSLPLGKTWALILRK
nr:TIGR00366 family protein [Escherichia coli]